MAQAGQVSRETAGRVDQKLAEAAFALVNNTLASEQQEELGHITQVPHHHDNTVSGWQALWGIFVILLIFTPLVGCYIYLAKQGMKGDLDLNWDSLENEPKNQLRIGGSKPRRPSHHDIDMPSSRKNSTSMEPELQPGAGVVSETIQDDGPGLFLKNDSCALIKLEDL